MNLNRRLAIVVGVGIIAIGITAYLFNSNTNDKSSPVLSDSSALDGLSKASRSSAYTERLGSDVVFPPTNSWISGMVLQKVPNPVYPMPYSFKPTTTGFEMNLPTISSTATEVNGTHTPSLIASFGATDFSLTHFDGVVARMQYTASDTPIADVTIASGSPYVFYKSLKENTLTLNGITNILESSSSYMRFEKDGNQYVATAQNGASIQKNGSTPTLKTPKDSLVTFYALPSNSSDILRSQAGTIITSAKVSYHEQNNSISTEIRYSTKDNAPTYFAAMGYHRLKGQETDVKYDSIYGTMPVYKGTTFHLTAPVVQASNSLDLARLSQEHKQSLIRSLTEDAKNTQFTAKDSYFAGKQLARAANLLDVAQQLGQDSVAADLKQKLTVAFADRLNNDYFYYDSQLKGVAASTAAFGSEDFNDHHFHYGYFIYAASILGRYDENFVSMHKDYINLLVADIGNYNLDDKNFPVNRNFDPYASHSWAAGLAPFADGNNQESSSEAIQAWNAITLWGDVTKNKNLSDNGRWLLAQETATAKTAWRTVDTSSEYLRNYTSPLASLSFGGKRTYATFFSDEPNTKLAIQLLPLNPMMQIFKEDDSRIKAQVDTAISNNNFNVALGDYVIMYAALTNPSRALEASTQQQNKFIDDGNSRTYMNAWIFTRADAQ